MPELETTTLDRLLPGEAGIIRGYSETRDLHHRLKELGLVAGTKVRVRRCAPFGDPIELSVRGYHLSIRKQDAAHILVEKTENCCGGGGGRRNRHGKQSHEQ